MPAVHVTEMSSLSVDSSTFSFAGSVRVLMVLMMLMVLIVLMLLYGVLGRGFHRTMNEK